MNYIVYFNIQLYFYMMNIVIQFFMSNFRIIFDLELNEYSSTKTKH